MKKETALVVFSGGQDSTTCLFWAKKNFSKVYALSFIYGQKHVKEVELARAIAQKAGVTQRLVSDFERGKVDIRVDTLCRLVIALDLCLSGIDERLACENEEESEW